MKPLEIKVRVTEAKYNDVNRGRARLPKRLMDYLGLSNYDLIEIEGSKKTNAVVLTAYKSDETQDAISIDSTIRKNAGVHLDEMVIVRKATAAIAKRVVYVPITEYTADNVERYIKRDLLGRPVSLGDIVRFKVRGKNIEYRVNFITPNVPTAIIDTDTIIEIDLDYQPKEDVSLYGLKNTPHIAYEDIGGLDEAIKRIREMVELPMRYPDLFTHLGIEPPKGVLLHGPPGTGKTLLAKALANETEAHFISISGPEIMSKYFGESEQKLRDIFTEAKEHSPSIIFIDEVDSIAPQRDDSSSGEVERRVVSQLLALLDGLEGRGEIIVIGATNRPNAIDPALRRPGRFDREIEIGVPDKNGRRAILEIHTRAMPLANDVDLNYIASRTHGFVGADLSLLVKEAALRAIRRVFPMIKIDDDLPYDIIGKLKVEKIDFDLALTEVQPSAMREFLVEKTNVRWEDVGGLTKIKNELKEILEWPTLFPELFDYMDVELPRGILLTGPPGTGKTLLVKAVANETNYNFINIKSSDIVSKWFGESEKAIRDVFKKAKQSAPCIVFFDEIDAIMSHRSSQNNADITNRLISTLLTEMDGLEELKNVLVIAATNRPDIIDPAILRPGRFDRIIEFSLPNEEERLDIIKIHIKEKPIAEDVDLEKLVDKTKGCNSSELAGMVKRASFLAVERFFMDNKEKLVNLSPEERAEIINKERPEILIEDFEKALKEIKKK